MNQLTVNEADIIRAREALLSGSLDAKRPTAWAVYGYPDHVSFDQYRTAYERTGAGRGAVHRLLDGCWADGIRIKSPASDKESATEKQIKAAMKRVRGWAKLRDLDRRQMIGR